jgi:acyl-CoA-binding protein
MLSRLNRCRLPSRLNRCLSSATEDAFKKAIATNGMKLAAVASDQEKKEMYALYKQATRGDATGERPGILDFVGRAKWDAWDELRGMPSDAAMRSYAERSYAIAGTSMDGEAEAPYVAASSAAFGQLSSDHAALKQASREYFMAELHPLLRHMDDTDSFPREVWPKLGEQGYLGLTIEEEYGGVGLDFLSAGLVGEELAYANHCLGISHAAHDNLCANSALRLALRLSSDGTGHDARARSGSRPARGRHSQIFT